MNASVGDEALDGLLGNLAAVGIEAGQDDRARRVVDDEVDAGGELERADVPSLASDDAALEIVARQIDDRHGRFDRVVGGASLNRLGDVLLGAIGRRFARFRVEALQQVRCVVPRVAFDLLDEQFLGFVGRQAGDAFELVLLLGDETFDIWRRLPRRSFRGRPARRPARASSFSIRSMPRLSFGKRRVAPGERLLERLGLLTFLAGLALGIRDQLVRFFLGVEERFLLSGARRRVRASLSEPSGLLFRAADGVGARCVCGSPPRQANTRQPRPA